MPGTHFRSVAASIAAAAAVALTCTAPAARGGLTTQFAVHEGVGASNGPSGQSAYLDATTLPIHQTLSAASGGLPSNPAVSAAATYDVTDDGTTVVYRVVSQGQLNALGNASAGSTSVGSGLSGPTATQFVLAAPATFVATLTSTGAVTVNASARLDAVGGLAPVEVFYLGQRTATTTTGTLAAGVPYTLYDSFGLSNTTFGYPMVNGSGTYAFALTLTAVPEPAAAGVAAAAAVVGLLGRRNRRRHP